MQAIHAEPEVLRAVHRDYASRLGHYRAIVDPRGVVQSRFLAELGVS